MGKDSPDAAPPRQLDVELQQILSQWPALLRGEQANTPGAVGLDLSNLELALEGAPAGTRSMPYTKEVSGYRNTKTGEFSTEPPRNAFGKVSRDWTPWTQQQQAFQDVDTPATPGLYDLLQTGSTRIGEIQRDANTTSRTATYNDLRNLNPEQARLYDLLASDAEAGLKAGDRLTREEQFNTVNPIRSDWAARGLGNSAPAQLDEAVNLVTAGRGVGQQRRANAAGTAQLGSQLYSLPSLTFAPDTMGTTQNFLGFGSGYGQQPSILQQLGGYGSDLFNTNFNATAANNINRANANNAQSAGAASAAAGIGAALIMACWAAREVFGAHDPQWKQFRQWMLTLASDRFRNWYLINGPRWAERLAANPVAKLIVRRWMERKIQEVQYV